MSKKPLIEIIKDKYGFSQEKARGLILSGNVLIEEKVISKPGYLFPESIEVRVRTKDRYVSRGAHKLNSVLPSLSFPVKDNWCLDVGSSTGGFTQVLLENGAKGVYAVDSGTNQLDYSLRTDTRVVVMEQTRIQDCSDSSFNPPPVSAVMDASFASALPIILHLYKKIGIEEILVLIKPQFEYMRLLHKLSLPPDFNGVIHDRPIFEKIRDYLIEECTQLQLPLAEVIESKVPGREGNHEVFFYLSTNTRKFQ